MSLLERVIVAHKCRSMHHYIVMEALGHIGGDDGEAWKAMLLRHNASLLEGAKAPDAQFKDFQNHVLHVSDGEWGGARDAAMDWYGRSIEALRDENWRDAAYCLGVLSHYYADVCQPFHTGQTEEEGAMHRAVEWSIVKSVDAILGQIVETGLPDVKAGTGPGFVADMVLDAAKVSHPHYQTFLDHYDLDAGVQDPPTGIDETMFDAVCKMVAYATSGFATLLTRAFEEAGVAAPKTNLTVRGYLASINVPVRWITKKLENRGDRKAVEKMYAEFQKTGKVIKTLPEDDKLIRKLHARQVLRVPLADVDAQELKPLGTKHVPWEMPDVEEIEDEVELEDETELEALEIETSGEEEIEEQELLETQALDDTSEDEPEMEAAPEKLTRAQRRDAKRAEKEARKAEKADAKLAAAEAKRAAQEEAEALEAELAEEARREAEEAAAARELEEAEVELAAEEAETAEYDVAEYEGDIDLDEEEHQDYDDDEIVLDLESADPDNEVQEYEEAYEDTEEFEAELAELAAIDLGDDAEEMIEAAQAAAADSESEEAATQHLRSDRLGLESPVVDAPSIGRKTAKRLAKANIRTVIDLLDADPEFVSEKLNVGYITPETITAWQDQTMLMMEVPGLRVHDVQVLVGAGIRTGEDLAKASAHDVLQAAMDFLATDDGERISRFEDETLEESEIEEWIDLARQEAA